MTIDDYRGGSPDQSGGPLHHGTQGLTLGGDWEWERDVSAG